MSQPRTEEVTQRLEAHKAAHIEYSKARHEMLLHQCIKKKSGMMFLVEDHLSAHSEYFPYEWSDEAAEAYLNSGTLPAKLEDFQSPGPYIIACAECFMSANRPHDMGKPSLLHATQFAESKVCYVIDIIGASPRLQEDMIYLIPAAFLDTPDLRRGNEEYLRTGIKPQQDVILRPCETQVHNGRTVLVPDLGQQL